MKLRALDLFCCAGGASAGLVAAGFDVVGVDIEPQPDYPFPIVRNDALTFLTQYVCGTPSGLEPKQHYDFVWASPPCQAFTAYKRRPDHVAPRDNLIPAVRELLRRTGVPYVIENVVGAPLIDPVMLCGSMFGLDVRRHRLFECSFPVMAPECRHDLQAPRFAPATNRKNLRRTVEVGVWRIPLDVQQRAMGIDWMPLEKLSQAIPPAYSEFLGKAALASMRRAA